MPIRVRGKYKRGIYLGNTKTPDELLKEYGEHIEICAKHYVNKGLEYNEAYNQIYLYFLEYYQLIDDPLELKYKVRDKMRNYYRKEIKERHIAYGIDQANIGR